MKVKIQSLIDIRAFWALLSVLTVYGASIILGQSELLLTRPEVFIGITYDLTILAPLLYLSIIWRSRLPRFTAVPVFIIGLLIASQIIPDYQRSHLAYIELIIVPLVELTVIAFIVIKVRRMIYEIMLNKRNDPDLYSVLKRAAGKVLENPIVGKIFATEIAMIYFGLFKWRRKTASTDQFTGHKENGLVAIFYTLVFLVITETFVVHLLLVKWHALTAWIVFALSLYAGVQLLGHTKALLSRFTELQKDKLILRYGLFGDAEIPLSQVAAVTSTSENLKGKMVRQLKMLGDLESHNVLVELTSPVAVESIYGTSKVADKILLHLDNHQDFIKQIHEKLKCHEEKD